MNGHTLSVERVIDARPEAIFDAFIAMYEDAPTFSTTVTRDDFAGAWPDVLAELAHRVSRTS